MAKFLIYVMLQHFIPCEVKVLSYTKIVHILASKIIGTLKCLPLDPLVNKSYNIESCGSKMHPIVANMMHGVSILTTST